MTAKEIKLSKQQFSHKTVYYIDGFGEGKEAISKGLYEYLESLTPTVEQEEALKALEELLTENIKGYNHPKVTLNKWTTLRIKNIKSYITQPKITVEQEETLEAFDYLCDIKGVKDLEYDYPKEKIYKVVQNYITQQNRAVEVINKIQNIHKITKEDMDKIVESKFMQVNQAFPKLLDYFNNMEKILKELEEEQK